MDELDLIQAAIARKQAEILEEENRLAGLRAELADLRRDLAHICDDIPYMPPGGQRQRTGTVRVDVARIVACAGSRGITRGELVQAIGDTTMRHVCHAVLRLVKQGAVRTESGRGSRVYPVDDRPIAAE
jgi:hypothetical protein